MMLKLGKPTNVGHPDQEMFDEIRIAKVERWKESELSGDEWRFNAAIYFYYKGTEVQVQVFSNIKTAVAWLPSLLSGGFECNDEIWKNIQSAAKDKCDQPGCCEPALYVHQLKGRFIGNEAIKRAVRDQGEYRKFCAKHRHRGDCGLDDADDNYVVSPINYRGE